MAHHARHRVAERRPAAVAHVHGARRVGRDVLEVHAHAFVATLFALAEIALLRAHRRNDALQRRGSELHVDEAGTRDVNRRDEVVFGQMIDDDLGDLARVLARKLRRAHGDGRRPVAVRLVARTLERRRRHAFEREASVVAGGLQRSADDLLQRFAHVHRGVHRVCPYLRFVGISSGGPLRAAGTEPRASCVRAGRRGADSNTGACRPHGAAWRRRMRRTSPP